MKMRRQVGMLLLTKIVARSPSPSPSILKFHQLTLSSPSHFWTIQNRRTTNAFLHNLPTKCKFPLTIPNTTSPRSFNSLDRRRRSIFRRFTTNGVVLGLIVTNVVVFLLWKVERKDSTFMVKNFVITVQHIKEGLLHTVLTNAFSHIDTYHLFTNILGLYFFGINIGRSFGPEYLVKLYLGGAVAGSIFYVVYRAFLAPPVQGKNKMKGIDNSIIPTTGASGAVYAIMLLDLFLFPSKNVLLLGLLIGGLDIWRLLRDDPRYSASTHLGGATVAAFVWLRDRKRRFRPL